MNTYNETVSANIRKEYIDSQTDDTGFNEFIKKYLSLKRDVNWMPLVRCKGCMWGTDYYHDGDCYCLNPKWGMKYFGGSWNFYCAEAERRENEL